MKKLLLLFVILHLFHNDFNAQNLVPNYSFENIAQCPGLDKIYYATPWFQPCIYSGNTTNSSSSDLYNACAPYWLQGVPVSVGGCFQYAKTGVGYAGIFAYGDTLNYREYIEIPLDTSLIANTTYCVEFYVSLSNAVGFGIAVSNIGAYFSNDSLLDNTHLHAIDYVTPQVENPVSNMLNDTLNWMLISGSFIASGGEKFMTIGNFHNVANTDTQIVNNSAILWRAYYFIDDVSVVCCGSVGVDELGIRNEELGIMPNPASGNLSLTLHFVEGIQSVKIFNILGECVLHHQLSTINYQLNLDVSALAKGLYFVQITDENKNVVNKKVVIQ